MERARIIFSPKNWSEEKWELFRLSLIDFNVQCFPLDFIPIADSGESISSSLIESLQQLRYRTFQEVDAYVPRLLPRVFAHENKRLLSAAEADNLADSEAVVAEFDGESFQCLEEVDQLDLTDTPCLKDFYRQYASRKFDSEHFLGMLKEGLDTKAYLESMDVEASEIQDLKGVFRARCSGSMFADIFSRSWCSWALYYGDLEAAEYFLKNGQVIEDEVEEFIEGRVQSFGISGGSVSSLELLKWCDKNDLMNPSMITTDLLKSLIPVNLDTFSVHSGNTYDDRLLGWKWLINKYGKSFYTGRCHPALEVLSLYNAIAPGFRGDSLSVFVNKVLIALNKKQPVTFSSFLRSPTFAASNHGNWAKSLVISDEAASENALPGFFSNYMWYSDALQVFVQSGIEDLGPELAWANNVYIRLSKHFYDQFTVTLLCLRRFVGCEMGWTNSHFRYMMRLLGGDAFLLFSEMVTAQALIFGDHQRHLEKKKEEGDVILQLGGSDVDAIARAIEIAEPYEYCGYNLNVGCPSDRVQKGRIGACLMEEPALVSSLLSAMRLATDKPISIKTRVGIDKVDSYDYLKDFVSKVLESGCQDWIIHARDAWLCGLSPKQNRTIPPLRYEYVYRLKEEFPELNITINGGFKDEVSIEDALGKVDSIMLGRAAYQNPNLIYSLGQQKETYREVLAKYVTYIRENINNVPVLVLVTPLVVALTGYVGAKKDRAALASCRCIKTLPGVLDSLHCFK